MRPRINGKNNINDQLQDKLVKFLNAQAEWNLSEGRDHIIMAHHPNSMLDARMKLSSSMFILSDFGSRPTLLYFQGAIYREDKRRSKEERTIY